MVTAKKVEWGALPGDERGLSRVAVEEYLGDEAGAARIIEITAAVGWGKYFGGPVEYAASFRREMRERGRRIFFAKVGPAAVGYAELVTRPSESWGVQDKEAYLFAVAILPQHARSGLARGLVERVIFEQSKRGMTALLTDVRWDNTASMHLSEQFGARMVGPSPRAVVESAGGVPHLRFKLPL